MSQPAQSFPSVTLPIDMEDGLQMDPAEARSLGCMLNEQYRNASPFPHIVLDNIFPDALINKIVENFPYQKSRADENMYNTGYGGENKRQILPEKTNRFSRELFWFLNSQPMLQFLEGLTGIEAVLPDPYYEGGGFHETGHGGLLGVHADFRINERLHLQRRMNLLVYLNPVWEDAWNGHLELWSKDMKTCEAKVAPILNRCVVFSTDADTWHGHPDPLNLPDASVKRRSIAMYYYTASKHVYDEAPNLSTIYMARPNDSAAVQAEARQLRKNEYMRYWLPPAALRAVNKLQNVIKKPGKDETSKDEETKTPV